MATVDIQEEQIDKKFTNFAIDDDWSVALLLDGTLINRYPNNDSRYAPTRKWIESLERMTNIYEAALTEKEEAARFARDSRKKKK